MKPTLTPETDAAIDLAIDPDGAREVLALCESLEEERNELREAMESLEKEWEKEGAWLNGPDDSSGDKAAGQVFQECAKKLQGIIENNTKTPPTDADATTSAYDKEINHYD